MRNIAIIGAEYKTTKTNLLTKKVIPCDEHQQYSIYLFTDGAWWGYDQKIDNLAHAEEIIKSYGISAVFTNANEANAYLDSVK